MLLPEVLCHRRAAVDDSVIEGLSEVHLHGPLPPADGRQVAVDVAPGCGDGLIEAVDDPVGRALEDCDLLGDFGDFRDDLGGGAACRESAIHANAVSVRR